MKIKIQQFLGNNHSWSIVSQNIARAFIKQNHEVHLFSTNGIDKFPKDLFPYLRDYKQIDDEMHLDTTPWKNMDKEYDMQLSYTAMKNFPSYLNNGKKNRFAIWNYETTILPDGFAKYHNFCDLMLPSSEFSKKIFKDNGIPEEKLVVVPHGINLEEYTNKDIYPLKTKKKYKILSNIAQPHVRKNIPGLFEAFGKAFTKDDDVCLVCKISVKKKEKPPAPIAVRSNRAAKKMNAKMAEKTAEQQKKERTMAFEIDFWAVYNEFCRKYPNHAEVEIITDFLETMTPLYNSCDMLFAMTRAECYFIPPREMGATGGFPIIPRHGGQLDYANDNNALLIEGKIIRCPKEMQYWSPSPLAECFEPDINDAVEKLRYAVNNYELLKAKFAPEWEYQTKSMTWDHVGQQIIGLCK